MRQWHAGCDSNTALVHSTLSRQNVTKAVIPDNAIFRLPDSSKTEFSHTYISVRKQYYYYYYLLLLLLLHVAI